MTFSRTMADIESDETSYGLPDCPMCWCQGVTPTYDFDLKPSSTFCTCLYGVALQYVCANSYATNIDVEFNGDSSDEPYKELYIAQEMAVRKHKQLLDTIDETIIEEWNLYNTEHELSTYDIEIKQRLCINKRNIALAECEQYHFTPFDTNYDWE